MASYKELVDYVLSSKSPRNSEKEVIYAMYSKGGGSVGRK